MGIENWICSQSEHLILMMRLVYVWTRHLGRWLVMQEVLTTYSFLSETQGSTSGNNEELFARREIGRLWCNISQEWESWIIPSIMKVTLMLKIESLMGFGQMQGVEPLVFVAHHEKSSRKVGWIDNVQDHKAWFEIIGVRVYLNNWFWARLGTIHIQLRLTS